MKVRGAHRLLIADLERTERPESIWDIVETSEGEYQAKPPWIDVGAIVVGIELENGTTLKTAITQSVQKLDIACWGDNFLAVLGKQEGTLGGYIFEARLVRPLTTIEVLENRTIPVEFELLDKARFIKLPNTIDETAPKYKSNSNY